MRYLITGITGFIGQELKKKIDGDIYGLVRWTHKKEKHEGYVPLYANLRDYGDVVKIVKNVQPDIVVNLAAITPVSLSFEKPFEYQETNYIGGINLVEANRRHNHNLSLFVQASTPEVYGIQNEFPIKETAKMNPNSPYAVSKAALDLYLMMLYRAYDFPVVFSRHANTYGRKDQTHFVIESIVTQMIKGNEIYLGDKEPVRDFLYVDDTVDFYLHLIKNGMPGEIYNAGWGEGYSIKEVVDLAKKLFDWNGKVYWNTIPHRAGEIPKLVLDASKAENQLGWKPKIALDEGLRKVYNYWLHKS